MTNNRKKKKNRKNLFRNNKINSFIVKDEKNEINNSLKDNNKEISLLDNFSEEKEINGDLKEEIFNNFNPEIDKEELIENEEFLNEIMVEKVENSLQKNLWNNSEEINNFSNQRFENFSKQSFEKDNNKSKSNNILDKGLNFIKSIFNNEEETVNQPVNIINDEIIINKEIVIKKDKYKKELASHYKGTNKRNKRPIRVAFHTTETIKELLNKLAEIESKEKNKKIYLVEVLEKAVAEYQKNHYPDLTLKNKEEK
jgi:hypothetical protein